MCSCVCVELPSQITPPSFSPTIGHTDTEVSGGAEASAREDPHAISSQPPGQRQRAPVVSSRPPTLLGLLLTHSPCAGSAPEPPSRLPPPCLPICLQNTRPSTPLSCLRMFTRAPGLAGSSASPTRNLRTQRRAFVSPPATSSWPPGPSKGSSSLDAPGSPSQHLSPPALPAPFDVSRPVWPLAVCPCKPPHCHPNAVPVSLEPCAGLTSSLWLRHPKLCHGHILPKRDPDQTRSVSVTPSPIEASPSPARSSGLSLRRSITSSWPLSKPDPGPSSDAAPLSCGLPLVLVVLPTGMRSSSSSHQLRPNPESPMKTPMAPAR